MSEDASEPVVVVGKVGSARSANMGPEDWANVWANGDTGFHRDNVTHFLEAYIDKLTAGRTGLKILVPLCGKTVDLKWLADRGHSVVGVECTEQGVKEFFAEQNVEHSVEKLESIQGNVYKSSDDKIHIYQCDMYDFSSSLEGKFDAIWDKSAIVAINVNDREKYVALLKTMMKPDCRILTVSDHYNQSEMEGPPHAFSDDTVAKLYGDDFLCEFIAQNDLLNDKWRGHGLSAFEEHIQLITRKS